MAKMKVRYRGIADERILSAEDLASVGVEGVSEDLVWNRRNLFSVDVEANDRLEEVLRAEGHFRIEKPTDNGESALLVEATDPDREGDLLVDGDTGATTTPKAKRR